MSRLQHFGKAPECLKMCESAESSTKHVNTQHSLHIIQTLSLADLPKCNAAADGQAQCQHSVD